MDPSSGAAISAISVAELVDQHADFVWRSLRRLGVSEGATDDATQQVFLVAQSKLESIAPGRERSFLFGVALNIAAHARRTVARRREVDESHAAAVVDPAPLPDAALDERRARALLDEVLDAMELDLRTVFVMFELEQMPMSEIAVVLGLPPGTVASRLRRAREDFHERARRLRARIDASGRARAATGGGSAHGSLPRLAMASGPDLEGGAR